MDAKDAAYGAQDIARAIINLAQTSMRSAIGSMELDKTFEQRGEINEKVFKAVADAVQLWGAHVTRYEIKDIKMPKTLLDSMERQMKAEREKRAKILESEGFRQSEINHPEGEKQSQILRADGEKQAAILVAEGQARAIELVREQIKAEVMLVADKLILGPVGLGYPLELQTQYWYKSKHIVIKALSRRTVSHSVGRIGRILAGREPIPAFPPPAHFEILALGLPERTFRQRIMAAERQSH